MSADVCAKTEGEEHHDASTTSVLTYIIASILISGVLLSYGLQDAKIISKRSSEGIAWLSILLACVSTTSNTLNILLVRWDTVQCCYHGWSAATCNAELLPVYQIFAGCVGTFILNCLLLAFFPVGGQSRSLSASEAAINEALEGEALLSYASSTRVSQLRLNADITLWERLVNRWTRFQRSRVAALTCFGLYIAINIVVFSVVAYFLLSQLGPDAEAVKGFGRALGYFATFAIVIQWTPQIIMTFRSQEIGSLSIPMLLLQAPGSFLVVIFQLMEEEAVSTWMPYFVTGVQQVILLILCIFFQVRDWQALKKMKRQGHSLSRSRGNVEETRNLLSDTDA